MSKSSVILYIPLTKPIVGIQVYSKHTQLSGTYFSPSYVQRLLLFAAKMQNSSSLPKHFIVDWVFTSEDLEIFIPYVNREYSNLFSLLRQSHASTREATLAIGSPASTMPPAWCRLLIPSRAGQAWVWVSLLELLFLFHIQPPVVKTQRTKHR